MHFFFHEENITWQTVGCITKCILFTQKWLIRTLIYVPNQNRNACMFYNSYHNLFDDLFKMIVTTDGRISNNLMYFSVINIIIIS